MADQVFECPFCHRKFRVPADIATERILCPHCTQVVDLPRSPQTAAEPVIRNELDSADTANAMVTECPTCAGAFQVLPSMMNQWVACPHCHSRLQIVPPDDPPHESPALSPSATDTSTSEATSTDGLNPELEKLLPPMFLVPSSHHHRGQSLTGADVLLPDAHGGFKKLDTSVRQIIVAGQAVSIRSISPATKRRRRTIRSIILFTLCGIILLLAFYVLSR